jgi:GTPase Era involved in 16S rRNA processing
MPDSYDKTWGEYRMLVLAQLEELKASVISVTEKIERFRAEDLAQIKTDITLLKFQAAMWGIAASTVVSIIVGLIVRYIKP